MPQRDEQWFRRRAGKFTGSRASDLMARTKTGPAASRKNLLVTLGVERITGECVETYQNGAMLRGIELEPVAREAYSNHQFVLVEEVDFLDHPVHAFIGCSPDGLVGDDGMVELKCPMSMAKHYEALLSGAHAQEYKWQLQANLAVSGRQWIDAVSFDPRFPPELRLAIVRVQRDEAMIAEYINACIAADREVEQIRNELLTRSLKRAA